MPAARRPLFDIRTGKVTAPPAYEAATTYPVRIVGEVQVKSVYPD
jgi:nitrite reductase/ring-hydroxylating ferredoxin subunit